MRKIIKFGFWLEEHTEDEYYDEGLGWWLTYKIRQLYSFLSLQKEAEKWFGSNINTTFY